MSDSGEPSAWLAYARENLESAKALLAGGWLNTCIQNAQQAAEKALKAGALARGLPGKRTHSIRELVRDLRDAGTPARLNEDECDLLDSVYLPSKYPPVSALPDAMPDRATAERCIRIAETAIEDAGAMVG
jgi:HEPN domain-containing protein